MFLKSPWSKMKNAKIVLISISWISCILFGSLYYVPGCAVELLSMDECFHWTSEDNCFLYQDPLNTASIDCYKMPSSDYSALLPPM